MADTTISATRDSIANRLKTWPKLTGVKLFDEQMTDAERLPQKEGYILPYMALVFGSRGRVALNQRGIVGSRYDSKNLYFGVECYAGDAATKMELADIVIDCLEGFEPVNGSEISSSYSGSIENPATVQQNSVRFGIGLTFDCIVNVELPDSALFMG